MSRGELAAGLIAAGAVLLIAVAICLVSAAATQDRVEAAEAASGDDLMAVADAVQDDVDIDEPVPFVPTDWNAPDVLWLETIGVEP